MLVWSLSHHDSRWCGWYVGVSFLENAGVCVGVCVGGPQQSYYCGCQCSPLSCVGAYINNKQNKKKTHYLPSWMHDKALYRHKLSFLCVSPPTLWVCVWESAQEPSHRSGALRLLIAHTNRLVIHVLPFMALFPAARAECLPPQVGSEGLASPVPRGRNRRLIGVPGCAVILLWKVFQAASQYWFFWAGGKLRRPPSEAVELGGRGGGGGGDR